MVVDAYCYFLDYMTKLVSVNIIKLKGKYFNELESTLDSELVIYQMDNDMACVHYNAYKKTPFSDDYKYGIIKSLLNDYYFTY